MVQNAGCALKKWAKTGGRKTGNGGQLPTFEPYFSLEWLADRMRFVK